MYGNNRRLPPWLESVMSGNYGTGTTNSGAYPSGQGSHYGGNSNGDSYGNVYGIGAPDQVGPGTTEYHFGQDYSLPQDTSKPGAPTTIGTGVKEYHWDDSPDFRRQDSTLESHAIQRDALAKSPETADRMMGTSGIDGSGSNSIRYNDGGDSPYSPRPEGGDRQLNRSSDTGYNPSWLSSNNAPPINPMTGSLPMPPRGPDFKNDFADGGPNSITPNSGAYGQGQGALYYQPNKNGTGGDGIYPGGSLTGNETSMLPMQQAFTSGGQQQGPTFYNSYFGGQAANAGNQNIGSEIFRGLGTDTYGPPSPPQYGPPNSTFDNYIPANEYLGSGE